jgi:uncharacterized membrane protein
MNGRFQRGIQYMPAHHWIAGIVILMMFVVLVGVIVWAVIRITRTDAAKRGPALSGPPPPPMAPAAPAPASAEDAALTALRMRYARGEIDRDEYVRVASDLGVTLPPEAP